MCVFGEGGKSIFGWSRDILIQVGPPNHFDLATALLNEYYSLIIMSEYDIFKFSDVRRAIESFEF